MECIKKELLFHICPWMLPFCTFYDFNENCSYPKLLELRRLLSKIGLKIEKYPLTVATVKFFLVSK